MIKLASYNLNPTQRLEWIDAQSRSNFLKHVPNEFAAECKEEEIKRGKRYTGPEIFTNYLEYQKASKRRNDLGIHNLRDGSNRRHRNSRNRERSGERPRRTNNPNRERTNNVRQGDPPREGTRSQSRRGFRRPNRGTRSNNRGGINGRGTRLSNLSEGRRNEAQDNRSSFNRGGSRGGFRQRDGKNPRNYTQGHAQRSFLDTIRKTLNLGPSDLACYLCGKRNDHISRTCDIYPNTRVQEQKCQNCLRFFHPTQACQSRIKGINNKEE